MSYIFYIPFISQKMEFGKDGKIEENDVKDAS